MKKVGTKDIENLIEANRTTLKLRNYQEIYLRHM